MNWAGAVSVAAKPAWWRLSCRMRQAAWAVGLCCVPGSVVLAMPTSTVVEGPFTQTSDEPSTLDWDAPTSGSVVGGSGRTYVSGVGSLSDGGTRTENGWVTTFAQNLHTGVIVGAELPRWNLDAAYWGRVKSQATFLFTGGVEENYRAEATGTAEIRGTWSCIEESQVAVDSYTTPGVSWYAATGGGSPPQTYADDSAVSLVVRAVSGQSTSAELSFGYGLLPPNGADWYGPGVQAVLYCRGKQYMHCAAEEDVSLATWIRVDETDEGEPGNWKGKLTSFYFENGIWIQIQQHVIG